MSDSVTKLAATLAEDVIALQDRSGEERLFVEVGAVLGAASQTLEEAFLTEVRIRLAERKARDFLKAKAQQLDTAAAPVQKG